MKNREIFITFVSVLILVLGNFHSVDAQQNLAQQVAAIFEQNCLNCHGEHGAFTEEIIIEHTALIETGSVVPRRPNASTLYKRLIEKRVEKRMPLGQPPLSPAAINTVRQWIVAGAPPWEDASKVDSPFITPKKMLNTIERHINSLAPFDRTFARYFTMAHLYNIGESFEALHAYQRALSKLVNSLSWGREVIRPEAIDPEETIFYIDLRDYEWEVGVNRWTLIEAEYPYKVEFNAPTETTLREKLTTLRQEMDCEVPFVHVDWFLATASLPPLYHDILGLPATVQELETRLEVSVVENIQNAAGKRVWRAGFNNSGVSNHNRVVERHTSRYGAYWKSYDFAGSVGTQNIFTHPLAFTYDGGEIVFNLPNGLQAYYLTDGGGNRLDAAPISIVSNPAASDPTVRNGLSCIGCHTEGMKTFEDQVRAVIQQNPNPRYNKAQALRLYAKKSVMNGLVSEDTQRYRQALEAAGDIFGGIEPIQRFYEAFQAPLDAAYAGASVGLETEAFLQKIRENRSLQSLGLLVLETGTVKRDTWTSNFSEVIDALSFPERHVVTPVVPQTISIPGASVYIPDPNLRAAIARALDKGPNAVITAEEMSTLRTLNARDYNIRDFTGLESAINLEQLKLRSELITDLSGLARSIGRLNTLKEIWIRGKMISDLSPLAALIHLEGLAVWELAIDNISPLSELTNLRWLELGHNQPKSVSDLSPLANLKGLQRLLLYSMGGISDISPLTNLTNLRALSLQHNGISDVSPLASLGKLERLSLEGNRISDFSPIAGLFGKIPIWTAGNPGFPTKGPKIEGPWLWMIAPTPGMSSIEAAESGIDFLARMSKGTVTELDIAKNGAKEGDTLGNRTWTIGKISPAHGNIDEMVNATNLVIDDAMYHVAYGLITIGSPKNQKVNLLVGSGNAVKIWLNGELVHNHPTVRGNKDYTEFLPVMLREGGNIVVVAVFQKKRPGETVWTGFFGFEGGTAYTVIPPGGSFAFSSTTTNILIGDRFTVDLNAEHVADLAGWQVDVAFDPTTLEAVEVNEGDFLKTGGGTTFFQKGTINNRLGKITGLSAARISEEGVKGSGTLLSVTFVAKASGETQVKLYDFEFGSATGTVIPTASPNITLTVGEYPAWDVNQDGRVSILDLILIAQRFGETVTANSEIDINDDGFINIQDLILVAQHLGESTGAASPSMLAMDAIENLDPVLIQGWIEQAVLEDDGSVAFREGIAYLQSLLALLVPEETVLLANYPNPFNPETWIPYHLANPSEVTISIYDVRGMLVRQLSLGHQHAGYYTDRSRAAYWDGRNAVGERVASGIYFYQLQAENLSYLRKMVILK